MNTFFRNLFNLDSKTKPVKSSGQRRKSADLDSLYTEPPRSRRSSLSSGTRADSTISGSSNRSKRSARTYSLETDTDVPRTISSRRSSGASTISSTSSRKSSLSAKTPAKAFPKGGSPKGGSPKVVRASSLKGLSSKGPKVPSPNSQKTVRTARSSSWEDEDIFSMSGVGQYRRRSL